MNNTVNTGTYQGDLYLADEISKHIVSELKLKEGDTVSKDKIIEYLAKAGVGPLWATDVAMVLRNMFGVTPIFYESIQDRLISDLSVINESASSTPDCTDRDVDMAVSLTVSNMAQESKSDIDDAILAALSLESLDTIAEIAVLAECLTEQEMLELESVYEAGGEALVESWYDLSVRPHMARFMDQAAVNALSEATGTDVVALSEFNARQMRQDRKAKRFGGATADRNFGNKIMRGTYEPASDQSDPLQKKADDARNGNMAVRYNNDKTMAGDKARHAAQSAGHADKASGGTGVTGSDAQAGAERKFARQKTAEFMNQPKAAPVNFPDDDQSLSQARQNRPSKDMKSYVRSKSQLPDQQSAQPAVNHSALFHNPTGFGDKAQQSSYANQHPIKRVMNKIAGMAHAVKGVFGGGKPAQPQPQTPGVEPSADGQAQSVTGRIGGMAKSYLSKLGSGMATHGANFGDSMKARLRTRHPGLAYALHGAPGSGEQTAAQHMGFHHQYKQMGYQLPGYDPDIHTPVDHMGAQANKTSAQARKIRAQRPPANRTSRNKDFIGGSPMGSPVGAS